MQERYGQWSWMPKGVYAGEVGWNPGDPTWFNPVTPQERGANIVNAYGGLNNIINQIKQAIINQKYNWAAELATYVLDSNPGNEEAKLLKAQAFRILAWKNPTSGGRNWYLTDARILEGKLDPKFLNQLSRTKERIIGTPIDVLLSLVRYQIDPQKSGNMNLTLGIKLNDADNSTSNNTGNEYKLQIRKAVLEFQRSFPSNPDVAITTDERTLKQVIAGIITLDEAIRLGKLKIDGDPLKLKQFVRVLDTGLTDKSPIPATVG